MPSGNKPKWLTVVFPTSTEMAKKQSERLKSRE